MKYFRELLSNIDRLSLSQKHVEAITLIDGELANFPAQSVELLAYAYDIAQQMPDKSRYAQYQSRYFDFCLKPEDKILDIGSGHIPFPYATHLADIALEDHTVGRAGTPFKHINGKPVYECSVEKTPFADKEFDFVYCSHVLEHVTNPEAACRELMRIAKRGYIECPARGKDTFFATAKISNHLWAVECINGVLVFTAYSEAEKEGVGSSILMDINCNPLTKREKAVAALDILRASRLNTMLLWDGSFPFEIRPLADWPTSVRGPCEDSAVPIPDLAKSGITRWTAAKSFLQRKLNALRSKLARLIEP